MGSTRRPERSSSLRPNRSSRARTCRLTAGWVTASRSAACEKLPRSTISQNRTSASGGGLYAHGGKVTVLDSTISKNQAANGGGLYSGGHVSQHGLRGRFDVSNSDFE